MPATEASAQSFMRARQGRRNSAYVPFSQTAAGLDASFTKESPEGKAWGSPGMGSQSVLPGVEPSVVDSIRIRSAMAASLPASHPARDETRKRSGSLKRQGEAGRSKGTQWSTSTHTDAGSDAMAQPGLLQQVVSWGRTDIVQSVLIEPQTVCTACTLRGYSVDTACTVHVYTHTACMCMCMLHVHVACACACTMCIPPTHRTSPR